MLFWIFSLGLIEYANVTVRLFVVKNDSNSKHSIIVMEAVAAGSSALGQRILGCALNSGL